MSDRIIEPTTVTWALVIFGAFTLAPLAMAQLVMLFKPRSRLASEFLVGKNQAWRDDTHFRLAYGCAWGDWLILLPLATVGSAVVINGYAWGYLLWAAAAVVTFYINTVLWFVERKYVMPAFGPLAYNTYYWGFFMLWSAAAFCYALLRLIGIML